MCFFGTILCPLPGMWPFKDVASAPSCPALSSLSLWECDPMLINLFLTMSGLRPKPQAHSSRAPPRSFSAFLVYRFFQGWKKGRLPPLGCTTRIFFSTLTDRPSWSTKTYEPTVVYNSRKHWSYSSTPTTFLFDTSSSLYRPTLLVSTSLLG